MTIDQDLQIRLEAIEKKLDAVYVSAEKSRKYLLWTGIIAVVVFVLPLLFLPFAVSQLLSTYSSIGNLGI